MDGTGVATVAGTELSYRLVGEGSAAIVVTSALGFASAEWWQLQDTLARSARVLTWDRPGYGESGPPRTPRTSANIAAEALALVDHLELGDRLILVGHSQGGLYANGLARLAAPRVSAVVLLDPLHPDNARFRRELSPALYTASGVDKTKNLRLGRRLAKLHATGTFRSAVMKGPPFLYSAAHSEEARDAMWKHLTRPLGYEIALQEVEESERDATPAALDAVGSFPPVPLRILVHTPTVVIAEMQKYGGTSREDGERIETIWRCLFEELLALSPRSSLAEAPDSGHFIHLQQPTWTADQIESVLSESGVI